MSILKYNFKKIGVLMLLICMACLGILGMKVYASEEFVINTNLNSLMEEINVMIENSDEKMFSSDPYDYIDSIYFDNIVNRGIAALPAIVDEIDKAEKNGLREYILAIAAEEISKKYLSGENVYKWANGKEWLSEWNIFLRNIPIRVDYIINDTESTIEEKEAALYELGIMSLPYIKDAVDKGKAEFQTVYDAMLGSDLGIQTYGDEKTNTLSASDLNVIRQMVEEVRVD